MIPLINVELTKKEMQKKVSMDLKAFCMHTCCHVLLLLREILVQAYAAYI